MFMGYLRKMRLNQESERHPFIHMNPLSRNPETAPAMPIMWGGGGGGGGEDGCLGMYINQHFNYASAKALTRHCSLSLRMCV